MFTENRELVRMFENIHLLRKLFIVKSSGNSPLHFGQMAIMRTIEGNENCTQSVIAERLGVTPSSVATSTKRLQKAGLITKTVDPDDIRCKRLTLTDKGREAIRQQIRRFDDYDEQVFGEFTDEERIQLSGYLERIVRNMQRAGGVTDTCATPMELARYLRETMDNLVPEE